MTVVMIHLLMVPVTLGRLKLVLPVLYLAERSVTPTTSVLALQQVDVVVYCLIGLNNKSH